jgi:hypothetical protein
MVGELERKGEEMSKDCGETFIHDGKRYYVGWMRSKMPGENKFGMWINEQPNGGFEWNFLDYKPKDEKNYTKIFILPRDPRGEAR